MQENLIGYLLGALDDVESARVEAQLECDPVLRARLGEAARSLQVLQRDPDDDLDPPSGLASSTCAFVKQASSVRLGEAYERAGGNSDWSITDVVVACAVVLAACFLFFPAVNNSRYHAKVAGCQHNLGSIGRGLIHFSESHPQGLFPAIPDRGNLAVAGMYAPTLLEAGFVQDERRFYCPSSFDLDPDWMCEIPSLEEIQNAKGSDVPAMQQGMGGGYGYNMGTRRGGGVCGVRNRSRSHFAMMSDTPATLPCEADGTQGIDHRNVLFESGRVRCLPTNMDCWCGDQLYVNDKGEVSAGVHEGDAVIGASDTSPFSSHEL